MKDGGGMRKERGVVDVKGDRMDGEEGREDCAGASFVSTDDEENVRGERVRHRQETYVRFGRVGSLVREVNEEGR
ncbi:hypothetical protein Tco_0644206 [Tanacetum coccineum]